MREAEAWLRQLSDDERLRAAAAALCAIGALPEARADAVIADAGWALAVRGRAPLELLGPRPPVRPARAATRPGPPPPTTLTAHGEQAIVRTDGWVRLVDATGHSTSIDGALPPILVAPPADPAVELRLEHRPVAQSRAAEQVRLAIGTGDDRVLRGTVDAVRAAHALDTEPPAAAHEAGDIVALRAPTITPDIRVDTGTARITVIALLPTRDAFLLVAHIWPWNPVAPATRLVPGDNSRIAWTAIDNLGHPSVGRFAFATLADSERFGAPADIGADVAIAFRPPIHPSATTVTVVMG